MRGYDRLEESLLCASLVFTTLVIFLQIIMRSVFNSSIPWSEELTRYIFIWQIWLGVSVAERNDDHIRLELVGSLVKHDGVKAAVRTVADLIMIAFNLFLTASGFELVRQMMARGNLSGALRLPMYLVYLALPLSSLLLCLRLAGRLVGRRAGRKED